MSGERLQLPAFGLLADGGKAFIYAALGDQFLMGAAFSDAAVVHQQGSGRRSGWWPGGGQW